MSNIVDLDSHRRAKPEPVKNTLKVAASFFGMVFVVFGLIVIVLGALIVLLGSSIVPTP